MQKLGYAQLITGIALSGHFAELVKTTEHRFSSLSFRLLTLIGTYYAIAGGVLKKLKLTIFARRWYQGGKTLLVYIAGLQKTVNFRVFLSESERTRFKVACAKNRTTMSQQAVELIREWLKTQENEIPSPDKKGKGD